MSRPSRTREPALPAGARFLLALSGGSDSVACLELLADRTPRPPLRAAYVDHGLDPRRAAREAAFCARLCAERDVPFDRLALDLDPLAPNWEAHARRARYTALFACARRTGHRHVVTGHHDQDRVETLLLRWMRGSPWPALGAARLGADGAAPRPLTGRFPGDPQLRRDRDLDPVHLVRPLAAWDRASIRAELVRRGVRWLEDDSNRDPRFARNRVRAILLPALVEASEEAHAQLGAMARACEHLAEVLARPGAALSWRRSRGGTLEVARSDLAGLPRAARRASLQRLLAEASGAALRPPDVERLLDALDRPDQRAAFSIDGAHVRLGGRTLRIVEGRRARRGRAAEGTPVVRLPPTGAVSVPGCGVLEVHRAASAGLSPLGDPDRLLLAGPVLESALHIRPPHPGERVRPLGAPGSRAVRRLLQDAGVPAARRSDARLLTAVPLDGGPEQVLWLVGVRVLEAARLPDAAGGPRLEVRRR